MEISTTIVERLLNAGNVPAWWALIKRLLLIVAVSAFAFFIGLGIAVGGVKAAAIFFGMLAVCAVLVFPARLLVYLVTILAFVVLGQALYFLRIDQAIWLPAVVCLVLYLRVFIELVSPANYQNNRLPFASLLILLFLGWGLFSSLYSWQSGWQLFLGSKDYLWYYSLFFFLLLTQMDMAVFDRLLRCIPVFMLAQLPFVAYQVLFVVPKRTTGIKWDSVVGMFGGDPNGGGASGMMAYFMLFGFFGVIELFQKKVISFRSVVFIAISTLAAIGFAEVKVAFILLPFMGIYLYWDVLFKRPILFMGATLLLIAVLWAGAYAYFKQFGENSSQRDLGSYIERTVELTVDPKIINYETGEIGRVAALVFWWQEASKIDVGRTFFGFGVGAVKTGKTMVGQIAARYYPLYRPGRNSVAVLLWEVGVVGALLIFAFFLATALLAKRVANWPQTLGRDKAWLRASSAALFFAVPMTIYNRDMTELPVSQVFYVLLASYVLVAYKFYRNRNE
ncbi:hypothetical protein [Chitinolyticbacter albus]|uniref:hypothetical protein n=1 Tax=Chitinolyticbacter albus TaxID=2961951 RepID=UPI00210A6C26|nr:hypothetical protein [Chitinolyticbacter albus]